MKNLIGFCAILFCYLALPFGVSGQQFSVDAPNPSEVLSYVDFEESTDGGFILSGYRASSLSQRGVITKVNPSVNPLVPLWTVMLGSGSILNASTKHNNDVISVGFGGESPLAIKVSSSGNVPSVSWAKHYTSPGVFSFQDVKTDPSGNVFISGIEDSTYNSSSGTNVVVRREFVLKLDQWGNPIWSKKTMGLTNRLTSKVMLRGDSVLVFGDGLYGSEDDISLSVFRQSDGVLIGHYYYNIPSMDETLLDVIAFSGGYVLAFESDNSLLPGVPVVSFVRLNASLNPVGSAWTLYSVSQSFRGGKLATDGTSVFLSGSVISSGFTSAYMAKLDMTVPSVSWVRRAVSGSPSGPAPYVTSSAALGYGVALLANKQNVNFGVTSIFTTLNTGGNPTYSQGYCDMPSTMTFELSNLWMTRSSLARTQMNLVFLFGDETYRDFSPVLTNCAFGILPVELVSFTGEVLGDASLLRWQTASEKDNSHFEVERSTDGLTSWEKIGQVSGAGDSQRLLSYEFVDVSPFNGVNYYRLVQVDFDGASEESPVVAVTHEGLQSSLSVFPNPLTLGVPLNVKGEFETVQVFDQAGREVVCTKNTMGQLSFGSVVPGMYNLIAFRANGSREAVKFIIQP